MRGTRNVLVMVIATGLVMSAATVTIGPSLRASAAPAARTAITRPNQATAARELATAVTSAPSFHAAVVAVRRALSHGGISTVRGAATLVRGTAPLAKNKVMGDATVAMAIELWRNPLHVGNTSLHDVAELMKTAHIRVGRASYGTFVTSLVNSWVTQARRNPTAPAAFVPLFLASLARHRGVGIDLGRPFRPVDVHLTGLESLLFWTAVDRGVTFTKPARVKSADTRVTSAVDGPCTNLSKELDALVPQVPWSRGSDLKMGSGGDIFKESLKSVLKKYAGEDFQRAFGDLMKLAKILQRIHTMTLLYQTASIGVFPNGAQSGPGRVQKPFKDAEDYAFLGRAGLSMEAADELRADAFTTSSVYQGIRDCARASGIPLLDDLTDVAADVHNWRIYWHNFGSGNVIASNALATVDLAASKFDAGLYRHKVKMDPDIDPYAGYAVLHVDLTPYQEPRDPNSPEFETPWGVTADLEANKPPDVKAIKGIVTAGMDLDKGGAKGPEPFGFGVAVANSVTDLLTNMTLSVASPHVRNYVSIVDRHPCDATTQQLVRLQAIRQVAGPTCGDFYFKSEGASTSGSWTAHYTNYCGGDMSGHKATSMTVGPAPADDFGHLVKGIGGVLITSLDSGGSLTGSETLDGVVQPDPDFVCPPCTVTTSQDGGPGSVNVFVKVQPGSGTATLNFSTGDVSFGHTSPVVDPCEVPMAGKNLPASISVPLAQLEAPGPHTYSVTRADDFTAFGVAIKGSMTLSMTILRVNADGTPYPGA